MRIVTALSFVWMFCLSCTVWANFYEKETTQYTDAQILAQFNMNEAQLKSAILADLTAREYPADGIDQIREIKVSGRWLRCFSELSETSWFGSAAWDCTFRWDLNYWKKDGSRWDRS